MAALARNSGGMAAALQCAKIAGTGPPPMKRLLAMVLAVALGAPLVADDLADIRAQAGARLFRAFLSADVDVDRKKVERDQILVVFLYADDRHRAADLAASFAGNPKEAVTIHGAPVLVELSSDTSLASYGSRIPAGIFLVQAPSQNTLKSLIRYGIDHHVIVYSPFEGHVERGVTGGTAVEAQVRPYVNQQTLEASNITLKPLFFKVTKVYR